MAVGDYSTDFHNVPGVRLGAVPCGIKGIDQLDLVLFEFVPGSVTAGIFTQSHFAAAPVLVG
ncbi:MAG: bifunctional ornithine acetyltransferase/N-acetylglutamate synthase, partial [Gammaproteobacteria bacterium]|nr:bifunctional ornithine acetyltransferase/N-acetylglutamate synthase [Gammaproteobacteria bacterium]